MIRIVVPATMVRSLLVNHYRDILIREIMWTATPVIQHPVGEIRAHSTIAPELLVTDSTLAVTILVTIERAKLHVLTVTLITIQLLRILEIHNMPPTALAVTRAISGGKGTILAEITVLYLKTGIATAMVVDATELTPVVFSQLSDKLI